MTREMTPLLQSIAIACLRLGRPVRSPFAGVEYLVRVGALRQEGDWYEPTANGWEMLEYLREVIS